MLIEAANVHVFDDSFNIQNSMFYKNCRGQDFCGIDVVVGRDSTPQA
ncbi:hypothetical protein ABAC402_10275 [Asticcacaulis sp. AC402]|nr:hypothetical protein ABAC402_10275 [Asticcacaulis sp. AC402]